MEFINQSKVDFVDISTEQFREYVFIIDGKEVVRRIDSPLKLSVSGNGHRLFDDQGISRYIPKGWIELRWKAKEGAPHFVA